MENIMNNPCSELIIANVASRGVPISEYMEGQDGQAKSDRTIASNTIESEITINNISRSILVQPISRGRTKSKPSGAGACKRRNFACDVCGILFHRHLDLLRHKRVHDGPIKCQLCDKVFKQKRNLKAHLKRHSNDKKFKCPDCEKSFISNYDLRRHSKTHSQSSKYCEVCDLNFPSQNQLVEHIKWHRDKNEFKCYICERAFTDNSTFEDHMKTHIFKFSCHNCERKFTTRFELDFHLLKCVIIISETDTSSGSDD